MLLSDEQFKEQERKRFRGQFHDRYVAKSVRPSVPGLNLRGIQNDCDAPVLDMNPVHFQKLSLKQQCEHIQAPLSHIHVPEKVRYSYEIWRKQKNYKRHTHHLAFLYYRDIGYSGHYQEYSLLAWLIRSAAYGAPERIAYRNEFFKLKDKIHSLHECLNCAQYNIVADSEMEAMSCNALRESPGYWRVGEYADAFRNLLDAMEQKKWMEECARDFGISVSPGNKIPDLTEVYAHYIFRAREIDIRNGITDLNHETETSYGNEYNTDFIDVDEAVEVWRALRPSKLRDIYIAMAKHQSYLSWPDLTLARNGKPLFVEVKNTDKLSPAQGRAIGEVLLPMGLETKVVVTCL